MIRVGLRSILLTAMLAAACSSGEDQNPVPTAPTPPPAVPSTPPPPPSNSCLPGAATNLASTLNGSTRTITWTAGANATDYDIQIGSRSGGTEHVDDNTTHTNYTWTGGGSGTTNIYYARVHSHNTCGSGPASLELVFH